MALPLLTNRIHWFGVPPSLVQRAEPWHPSLAAAGRARPTSLFSILAEIQSHGVTRSHSLQ